MLWKVRVFQYYVDGEYNLYIKKIFSSTKGSTDISPNCDRILARNFA